MDARRSGRRISQKAQVKNDGSLDKGYGNEDKVRFERF